jgi:hypothetical protein
MNITVTENKSVFIVVNRGVDGLQGIGVSAGGTTGQVLAKASNSNYDTEWADAGSGEGDVEGPASAVSGNFASFDGVTGKVIKDSGSKAADFAAASHTHITEDAEVLLDILLNGGDGTIIPAIDELLNGG